MKKVLMDLHPCFDGFAGIPQDARLTFGLLADSDQYEVAGHLFDKDYGTSGFVWKNHSELADQINQMSEYIIGLGTSDRRYDYGMSKNRAIQSILKAYSKFKWGRIFVRNLISRGIFQPDETLHEIDSNFFHDYLWRTIFEKSLTADKKPDVIKAKFYGGSMSRAYMCRVIKNDRRAPFLDTTGWDIYISQTPFPGKISGNTKNVIRFHDAVPILNPTTIHNPFDHHQTVAKSLRLNAENSHFVCNSSATREQLLTLYPKLEDRAHVVHCCVPDIFRPSARNSVCDIVARCANTRMIGVTGFSETTKYKAFVEERFNDDYLIAVGTIEPRKNYRSIIDGWSQFRKSSGRDIKLVIVGSEGWGEEKLKDQFITHSHKGDLFILSNANLNELIELYSNAKACIVASYTEGFSYSGIESMRCNTPVIASDIPVHREVYGEHAIYFDPYSQDKLSTAIAKIANMSAEEKCEIADSARSFSMRYGEKPSKQAWENVLSRIMQY